MYDDAGTLVTGSFVDYLRADGGRHDQLRHRPHDDARRRPTRSAPRASARRARSPRRRPWSTRSSTRSATSASTTSRCRARPSGSGRRSTPAAPSGAAPTEGAAMPHFDERPNTGPDQHGRSRPVIPAKFDYLAPTTVEEALSALAEHGDDAKSWPAGRACCRCSGCGSTRPRWSIDLGRIDALRGVRDDGDAIVIGAMTTHSDVARRRPGRASTRSLITKAVERARRPADPAPRHLRRRAGARRPGRRPAARRRWRWTPSS